MTEVKASCPDCGDITLGADDVRFVVCSVADLSFYAFTCTECHERVQKPATEEVIRVLTLGGIEPERLDVPAEALEEKRGPAICWDDVLDFAAELADL